MATGRPPAPPGVNAKKWSDSQDALAACGMPRDKINTITTLRQMNLFIWLVTVMQHPWQFVMDNQIELLKPKIDKSVVRYKGKRAT